MTNDKPRRTDASAADRASALRSRLARQQRAQQQALNSINTNTGTNRVSPATNPASSGLTRPAPNYFNDDFSTTATLGSDGALYVSSRRSHPGAPPTIEPRDELFESVGSQFDQPLNPFGQPGQFPAELDIPMTRSPPAPNASRYPYAEYPPQASQRFRTRPSPRQPDMRRPSFQNPPAPRPVPSVPTQMYPNDRSKESDSFVYYTDQANASSSRRKPR